MDRQNDLVPDSHDVHLLSKTSSVPETALAFAGAFFVEEFFRKDFWEKKMARDFSKRFYDSKAWKDLARLIREKKHFICDKCGRPGAHQVHHIIELTPDNINNPSISLNPRNLMLLCNDCHNRLHHRFEQGASSRTYSYDSEGHVVAVREKERRH